MPPRYPWLSPTPRPHTPKPCVEFAPRTDDHSGRCESSPPCVNGNVKPVYEWDVTCHHSDHSDKTSPSVVRTYDAHHYPTQQFLYYQGSCTSPHSPQRLFNSRPRRACWLNLCKPLTHSSAIEHDTHSAVNTKEAHRRPRALVTMSNIEVCNFRCNLSQFAARQVQGHG